MVAPQTLLQRPFQRFAAWRPSTRERAALACLLFLAAVTRIVNLDRLEPNILPDEADHLQLIYRILAGWGPNIFDLSWDGNPAASLYPGVLFASIFGGSYVS